MKPLVVIGLILIVLGIITFVVPTFTYFTTESVADTDYFQMNVSRPHTIILNPIVGGIALIVGSFLVLIGRRSPTR